MNFGARKFMLTYITSTIIFMLGWFSHFLVERSIRPKPTTFSFIDAVDVDAKRTGNPSGKLRLVIETEDGRRLGVSEWKNVAELPKDKP